MMPPLPQRASAARGKLMVAGAAHSSNLRLRKARAYGNYRVLWGASTIRTETMNPAHWHLAMNHIPVLGTAFGMGLMGWALIRKSEELKKVSLGVFVIVALLTIPVYLTGEPAEHFIEDVPGVSEEAIEEHEDAAIFAFGGILAVGAVSLAGLTLFRRSKPDWITIVVFVLSVVVFAMMVRTANLGGLVRHPEMRSDFRPEAESVEPHGD
jgi:uncharacterized membrane protein